MAIDEGARMHDDTDAAVTLPLTDTYDDVEFAAVRLRARQGSLPALLYRPRVEGPAVPCRGAGGGGVLGQRVHPSSGGDAGSPWLRDPGAGLLPG